MFDARKLLDMLVQGGGNAAQQAGGLQGMLGQVGSVVGQVLNQAQAGVQQGAGQINNATGIGQKATDLLQQRTGQTPADLLAKAKNLAAANPLATGAALGGLAAVLLGTGAGRSITGSVARMGGMALVGGLAYKAFQNYQAGRPLIDSGNAAAELQQAPPALPAPAEGQAHATRLVRAMIAAASADGVIDDVERQAILGNLRAAGLDGEAAEFLNNEFANPADIATLADGVNGQDEAAQVYAAARLAIDPDTQDEQDFLAALADALAMDAGLVAHIDAAASSAKG